MATFSELRKGTRARRAVPLRLGDDVVTVDVRVLGPGDDVEIAKRAAAYAKAAGVDRPEDGERVYESAVRAFTLALACIDHDSPADAPRPFFDGGAEQILSERDALTNDHVSYLLEAQAFFQDECSPRPRNMSDAEYAQAIERCAEGDLRFFCELSPGLQWSFVRFMAAQLRTLPTPSSTSISPSEMI